MNNKLVSFDTPLRNGDVVEITTKDSAKPTLKWLEFAKTSLARKHIRQALEVPERGVTQPVKEDSRIARKKLAKVKKRTKR